MNILQVTNTEFIDRFSYQFLMRILIDILAVSVMVRLVYFRYYKKSDLFLTFFGFNLIIFLVSYLLNKVDMTLGAAFGLFAVFSMLRFRTEGINTKDMTYLFLVIAMGLVTAISKGTWQEMILINLVIIGLTFLIESSILIKKEAFHVIDYDNLEFLKPQNRAELMKDIQNRTGLEIHRIEIIKIDLLKDAALLHAYYYC